MGQKRRGSRLKRFVFWVIASCVVLVILALVGGYIAFTYFINSPEFRNQLERRIAQKVHVNDVSLGELNWGGTSLGTDSITMDGDQLLRSVNVGKFDAVIDRKSILDRHLRIRELKIDHVNIRLVQEKKDDTQVKPVPGPRPWDDRPTPQPSGGKAAEKSWLERNFIPEQFSIDSAGVRNVSLHYTDSDGDEYSIDSVRATLTPEPANNEYKMSLEGGAIRLPFDMVSAGRLDTALVRYKPGRITVTSCHLVPSYGGHIDAEGEWEETLSRWSANLVVRDVRCINLLDEDWKKRVDGVMNGTARFRGEQGELVEVTGRVQIDKAVLTALPVLDTLAAFTQTNKFRRVNFNAAEAKFRYADESWTISDIVLASDGLMRIEGWIGISDEGDLSGRLQVGIVPGILSNIPGAEEKVFLPENNAHKMGLLWTNVNLSGTTDFPKEDLSARLVAAAGDRLFEIIPGTGRKALLFTGDLASRLLGSMQTPRDEEDRPDGNTPEKGREEDIREIPAELLNDALDTATGLFGL